MPPATANISLGPTQDVGSQQGFSWGWLAPGSAVALGQQLLLPPAKGQGTALQAGGQQLLGQGQPLPWGLCRDPCTAWGWEEACRPPWAGLGPPQDRQRCRLPRSSRSHLVFQVLGLQAAAPGGQWGAVGAGLSRSSLLALGLDLQPRTTAQAHPWIPRTPDPSLIPEPPRRPKHGYLQTPPGASLRPGGPRWLGISYRRSLQLRDVPPRCGLCRGRAATRKTFSRLEPRLCPARGCEVLQALRWGHCRAQPCRQPSERPRGATKPTSCTPIPPWGRVPACPLPTPGCCWALPPPQPPPVSHRALLQHEGARGARCPAALLLVTALPCGQPDQPQPQPQPQPWPRWALHGPRGGSVPAPRCQVRGPRGWGCFVGAQSRPGTTKGRCPHT